MNSVFLSSHPYAQDIRPLPPCLCVSSSPVSRLHIWCADPTRNNPTEPFVNTPKIALQIVFLIYFGKTSPNFLAIENDSGRKWGNPFGLILICWSTHHVAIVVSCCSTGISLAHAPFTCFPFLFWSFLFFGNTSQEALISCRALRCAILACRRCSVSTSVGRELPRVVE